MISSFFQNAIILGELRQPGRKAASFLALFWQRFADTFFQTLLVFPATLLGGSNKEIQLSLPLSSDMQISMEIQREHTLIREQRL